MENTIGSYAGNKKGTAIRSDERRLRGRKRMTDEREATARKVYEEVCKSPGITPVYLAKRLGMTRMQVVGALSFMEQIDLLVSEDGWGGIHPFINKEAKYGG